MFEKAKWITANSIREWRHPAVDNPPPSPYITKDFVITEGVKSVTLSVCGLGQAVYYLNGKRLQGSVHPTHISDYTKSVVYNTYDLTELVEVGKNRFGAILGHIYLADPENAFRMGTPRMIAEIDIVYADGKSESIVSNTSFVVHPSPTLFSLRRCGEKYDAKSEIPNWCEPSYLQEGWAKASICCGPGGSFRKKICPPKRVTEEIEGKEIAKGVFDFGENLSGWVRVTFNSEYIEPIEIKYSEWLSDDGQHTSDCGLQKVNVNEMRHKDVYLPKGKKGESFEPLFTYHGFRYAEIVGADKVSVTALKVHTDIKPLCSFECNDEVLNEIHKYCNRSILACAQGAMVDCPQREQNEWTGDGMLTSEVIAMQYDSYDMFYEWMLNYKDAQFADGFLPAIIPCRFNWPYSFANGLDWSSALIHIPYYCYKYSGNISIVETMWENMERIMRYFASRSENGLMDFGVGDWLSIDPMCPIEITDTAYYRIDALMMAEMASALKKDATPYCVLAENVKKDFRAKYVVGGQLTDRTFTPLICSIYSGMLESDEIPSHLDEIVKIIKDNGYAFRCGVHGLRMLFDVLGQYGYNDLVYKVLTNDSKIGYARCVADKITSLPEEFDYRSEKTPDGVQYSLNHHFTAVVEGWFFRYLAGIRLEGFGWESLTIEPRLVKGIDDFSASVRGVKVKKCGKTIKITSPYDFNLVLGENNGRYKAGEYEFTIGE